MDASSFNPDDLPDTFTVNDWIPVAIVPAFPVNVDAGQFGFVIRSLKPIGEHVWDNQTLLWAVRDLDTRRLWLWDRGENPTESFAGTWAEDETGVTATVGTLQVTWLGPPSP